MQALLSEHWHAVRFLRPRLREGITPLHRRLRGRNWVLLHDPLTQRFHRMSPEVFRVISLLDGQRTLDEVWTHACAFAAEDPNAPPAIGQQDLVQLLSQLYSNDLLQTQLSPDASEVFNRYKKQANARLKQSWLNPLSIKIPLMYPDAWFEKQTWLARRMFLWGMVASWLAWITPAGLLAWQHWDALTANLSDRVLSASNLVLLWFTYPLVKAVHEWAHGLAVKAWGGTVREIGIMLVMFTPVPYVDATSSYAFASKWSRAAVAAAGIMAELFIGACALYVWLLAEPGLVTAIAFNVVLITGVSTLVVNGNPLMRYDGYFIACDLLESPNLAQRATQYWTYLIDRYAYGAADAQPPMGADRERGLLGVYGIVAPIYRFTITLGIIGFIATQYFVFGILLAICAAWMSIVMPLWKGWKHLRDAGSLAKRREIVMRRTALALGLLVALIGLVPAPFYSVHEAVVWLPDEAIVRPQAPGHIEQVHIRPGQNVQAGQAIAQLVNLSLTAELEGAAAQVQGLEARLRAAQLEDEVRAEGLRQELIAETARLKDLESRFRAQQLAPGTSGRWIPAQATELQGRYVKRGEVVGYVVDAPSRLLRVAITQEDMNLIRARAGRIEARLAQAPHAAIPGRMSRQLPGGSEQLVSPALGTNGGGAIPVDPAQQEGTQALHKVFDLEIELVRPSARSVFGDRAYVRFDLGWAPLSWQWFIRLRQLFLSHLNV